MNKLFTLLIVVTLSLAVTGCKTFQPTAYKTLKATADSVDIAMKAFADAVVTPGTNISADSQLKVQELHEQFQVAFRQAVTAAQFDIQSATPVQVAALASQITTLIASYVIK